MDNYNNIVKSVRSQPSLQRDVGSLADEAGKKVKSGAVFNEGDTIVPKIGNVKLFASPADGAQDRRDALQGRRDDLHGRGEERLPEGRVRQRLRLGEEGAGVEVSAAAPRPPGPAASATARSAACGRGTPRTLPSRRGCRPARGSSARKRRATSRVEDAVLFECAERIGRRALPPTCSCSSPAA